MRRVWVAHRTDRSLLCPLYEQDRQLCSARVDWFGEIEAPQPRMLDDKQPVAQKVAQVMIVIGEKYAKGDIEQGDRTTCYNMRGQLMKDYGVNRQPSGEPPTNKFKPETEENPSAKFLP